MPWAGPVSGASFASLAPEHRRHSLVEWLSDVAATLGGSVTRARQAPQRWQCASRCSPLTRPKVPTAWAGRSAGPGAEQPLLLRQIDVGLIGSFVRHRVSPPQPFPSAGHDFGLRSAYQAPRILPGARRSAPQRDLRPWRDVLPTSRSSSARPAQTAHRTSLPLITPCSRQIPA